jgi:hypothetical protein
MYDKHRKNKTGRGKLPRARQIIKQYFYRTALLCALNNSPVVFAEQSAGGLSPETVDKLLKLKMDIQFFGDFYIPSHILKKTKSSLGKPLLISGVRDLFMTSHANIVNFEGVSTGVFFPGLPYKKYFLRMPLWIPKLLKPLRVPLVTLGNNHSLDLGYQGVFDTEARFADEGIQVIGAGSNLKEALRPGVLWIKNQSVCLISFNRTLPEEFWATDEMPGTAYLNFTQTAEWVGQLSKVCNLVIPIFHWGSEGMKKPKAYQEKLSKLVIDAGAAAVVGHHPHVIQTITSYKGKPIFYSLGNSVFGTKPFKGKSSGIAAGLVLTRNKVKEFRVTELHVDNNEVLFVPKIMSKGSTLKTHFSNAMLTLCNDITQGSLKCDMTKSKFY